MVCLACHTVSSGNLCASCRGSLRAAPDRLLPGGVRLVGAFEHHGAAKALVHHLKYRGVVSYAELVAERLAVRLPAIPLVPVPRAFTRRLRYGVDPAREIAVALGHHLGVPVVEALAHPLHAPRRAGRDHSRRVRPFRTRRPLRFPVLVVDDVVTTGATAMAAVHAIGPDLVRAVAAANVVVEMSNLDRRVTSPEPGGTEFGKRSDR